MSGVRKIVIVGIATAAAASLIFLITSYFGPIVRYQNDLASHRVIAAAYRKFYRNEGRAPVTLRELVAADYLPRTSYIYSSPGPLFAREAVSFELSVYGVVPPDNKLCKVERFCVRRISDGDSGFKQEYSEVKMDDLYPVRKN